MPLWRLILCAAVILFAAAGPAAGTAEAVELAAESAILVDAASGRILWSKRAHAPAPPAALAMIATAWVALDHIKPDEGIRVSSAAASAPGSRLGLQAGEAVEAGSLLLGMWMRSGNDAASALAEHIAGSAEAFARLMDSRVRAAGAEATHFVNPHGLDAPGQRTTAYDLARIARAALADEAFAQMASARRGWIRRRGEAPRALLNINSFLWRYEGATGVKTGYTPQAGYSLVASARRGGVELIVALLNAPTSVDRWRDAQSLMDYGFRHHQRLMAAPEVDAELYQVAAGDTLTGIARRFGVTVPALLDLNGLEDADRIRLGDVLRIPR